MTISPIKRNTAIYIIFLTILLCIPALTFAQEAFVPLTEIPGVTNAGSFSGFLNGAFKLGLAISATLAVVMITIGGFQYMASESVFSKSAGRERIQNAVVGLLIALLIWLILFTINPKLLEFDIKVNKLNIEKLIPKEQVSDYKGGKTFTKEEQDTISNQTPTSS